MKLKGLASKIIVTILYVLPVIFFTIVYFLQVVSSEDIYQGAGRPVSIIVDALSAFHWSARLGDMYAWSVINFFDYKYSFGVDTFFRLFDVILVFGIFFIMTSIILGRRPKWQIKDALLFCVSFLAVFLSPYSRPIMSSFSQIHNYLPIALLSLLFLLPFARQLRGHLLPRSRINKILMLIVGFLFGFSSNVTPVTFLITAGLVVLYERFIKERKTQLKDIFTSWQFFALIGIFLALVVMYVMGSGVSSYTHGYDSGYVSISDLIVHPGSKGVVVLGNIVHNFQSVVPMILLMSFATLFEYVIYRKTLMPRRQELVPGVKFSLICLVFFSIHILAVSQVDISTMTRILLPAYICAVVSILFTVNRLVNILKIHNKTLVLISLLTIFLTFIITLDIGIGMIKHQQQSSVVLDRIKNAQTAIVCVTPAENPTAKSPLLKYYQRELFVTWAMPEVIYGKQVVWCR